MKFPLTHQTAIVLQQTDANNDSQLVEVWLGNRPLSTTRIYRTAANQFLNFVNKPIAAVKLENLQEWCLRLNSKYKPSTIKTKVSAVKSLFSFALKIGYLKINVAAALKAQKTWVELSNRILSRDEVKRLIEAVKPGRDRLILESLYVLGLRISELHGLTWNDLRLRPDGGAIATIRGKGHKSRFVNIPAKLFEKLKQIKPEAKDYFFYNYQGTRLSKQAIDKIIKSAAAVAGLGKKVSAHWLRHAHASHSLDAGCDLNLLKTSLGHSSLAITEVYLHVNPDRSSSQYLDF